MKAIVAMITLCMTLSGYSPALADSWDEEQEDNDVKCRFCLRGDLNRRCCYFIIFKAGYYFNTSGSDSDDFSEKKYPPSSLLVNDIGLLVKLGSKDGLGASLTMLSNDESSKYGVRIHYRRWLDNETSLNFSSGIIFPGDEGWGHHNDRGFMSSISLDYQNLLSLDLIYTKVGYDYTYADYSGWEIPAPTFTTHRNTSSLYMGISGNSYLAPVVVALWAIPLLMSASSFSGI